MRTARSIEQWMRDKERDASHQDRLKLARIPEKYRHLTWDDYDSGALVVVDETGKTDSAKKMIRSYSEDWDDVKADGDGLVLLGPAGHGKTLAAVLAAMDVIKQGGWVRFTSMFELVQRETDLVRLAINAQETDDWEEHEKEELRLRWIKQDCDLLVVDDVGKERRSASDFRSDILEALLRSRVFGSKCTIITSNLTDADDWAVYNHTMESFLQEVGDVLEFVPSDDRRPDTVRPTRLKRRARG